MKALALISEMSDGGDDNIESMSTKAVDLIKDIVNSNPSIDDISKFGVQYYLSSMMVI